DARVGFDYAIESLVKKDSLELDDADRELIHARVAACPAEHILITHGTDTMTVTAAALADIPDKVIVLTGAMQPDRKSTRLNSTTLFRSRTRGSGSIMPSSRW